MNAERFTSIHQYRDETMMRHRAVIAILLCAVPATLLAGEWHVAGSLRCGDCHLQHSSSEMNPPGGPFTYMLKKNSVNELCLSCHDGTDQNAPDIAAPVQMYSSPTSPESAGGFFGQSGIESHNGHSLGLVLGTPLQSVPRSEELNCASCHAVHGNANYRNLSHDPAGSGANLQVIDGTDLFTLHKPGNPPTNAATVPAYERENVAYVTSRLDEWCTSCHDQLAVNGSGAYPAHFDSHPSDVAINQFSLESHTDVAHWLAGLGEGFAPAVDGILRVPFLAPQATTYVTARTPQAANQVSCMSCHKAHGSANKHGMLWPYYEGGAAYIAGCQQCHNK